MKIVDRKFTSAALRAGTWWLPTVMAMILMCGLFAFLFQSAPPWFVGIVMGALATLYTRQRMRLEADVLELMGDREAKS